VDTRTDESWQRQCKQEDSGDVRSDIVPVLACFDGHAGEIADFASFDELIGRHTSFILQPFYHGGDLSHVIERTLRSQGGGLPPLVRLQITRHKRAQKMYGLFTYNP